jgi:CubicO group peptidase (beta-lactamase class C family)
MRKSIIQFLAAAFLISASPLLRLTAQTSSERIKNIEATFPVVDQLFKDYAIKNHFPGLVYGLILDGKLIHTGNFGYSNLAEKIPADSKSEFRIASMTKSFTAMAILKLRDEGKLKLDDPVYLYIPEMKGQKYLTSDASDITIRHLLTHNAGFPEDNPWGDRQLAVSDEKLIGIIKKGISFSNNPGTSYEYSNLGFAMLGYIIKIVSGQPYETYITKNILEPLNMSHTYWEYSKIPANDLAHGYRWLNGQWTEQQLLHDGAFGAMGGLITSIEDFSKYLSLHLSAWPQRSGPENGPVKRSSIREMQFPWNICYLAPDFRYPDGRKCPVVWAYAYGLTWTKDCDGRIMIGHGGGLPGFGSHWRIMPDYGIGVVSFSNLTYASAGSINLKVLDSLIILAKLKPFPLPVSSILNQRKNELIKVLPEWKNPESAGIFAENFFLDYFTGTLQKEALEIFKSAGKIIHIREIIPENNLRGTFIMEGENSDIEIGFTLSPENPPLIQEYHIEKREKNR